MTTTFDQKLIDEARARLDEEYWFRVEQSGHPEGKPWALRKNTGNTAVSYHPSREEAANAKTEAIESECKRLEKLLTQEAR